MLFLVRARRRPDLVLMDLLLPGRSGLQIGAALKRRPSAPKVVLVSLGNGSVYARETREFGIDGVVGRSDLAAEMPALLDKLFPGRLPRRTPRIVPADDAATPGPGARGAPEPGEPTLRSAAGR
jgi:DNA-binding NarL/FixJ family response regulator